MTDIHVKGSEYPYILDDKMKTARIPPGQKTVVMSLEVTNDKNVYALTEDEFLEAMQPVWEHIARVHYRSVEI